MKRIRILLLLCLLPLCSCSSKTSAKKVIKDQYKEYGGDAWKSVQEMYIFDYEQIGNTEYWIVTMYGKENLASDGSVYGGNKYLIDTKTKKIKHFS